MAEEFIYSDPENDANRGVSIDTHPYQGSQLDDAGFDFLTEEIKHFSKDTTAGKADTARPAVIVTSPVRSPRVRSQGALRLLAKGKVVPSVPEPAKSSDARFGLLQSQIDKISELQNAQFQRILEVMGERKRDGSPQESGSTSAKRKRYLRTDTSPHSSSGSADSSEEEDLTGTARMHASATLPPTPASPSGATPVPQVTLGNEVTSLLADDAPSLDTSDVILQEFFPQQRDDVKRGPPLHDKVAQLLDEKWSKRLTTEDFKLLGDISIPHNVKNIVTPTVNEEVWSSISKDNRTIELRNIHVQENVQRAALIAASTIDFLLSKERASRSGTTPPDPLYRDLMQQNMNSVALLGNVSHHLTFMRRQRLKNLISPKIAGICELKYEDPHNLLFGDDFSASIARAEQKHKIRETVKKSFDKKQDFRLGQPKKKPPFKKEPPANRKNYKRGSKKPYPNMGQRNGGYSKWNR